MAGYRASVLYSRDLIDCGDSLRGPPPRCPVDRSNQWKAFRECGSRLGIRNVTRENYREKVMGFWNLNTSVLMEFPHLFHDLALIDEARGQLALDRLVAYRAASPAMLRDAHREISILLSGQ